MSDTGRPRTTDDGELVADLVEVFAPVVFEPHRRYERPTTGIVVLDLCRCASARSTSTAGGRPGGEVAFDVFAAMGYADDRPVFLGLEAFPDASTANWVQFLRGGAITGKPVRGPHR